MPISEKFTIITCDFEDAGIRVDRWFLRHYAGYPNSELQKKLRSGLFKINGKKAKAADRIPSNAQIAIYHKFYQELESGEFQEEKTEISNIQKKYLDMFDDAIIYEDDNIIAIDKPAGMAVQGGSGISISIDDIIHKISEDKKYPLKLVHRLDKETSGILLIAKTPTAAANLTSQFARKEIKKRYIAIVCGRMPKGDKIDLPIIQDGKEYKSLTNYKELDHVQMFSLVEFQPQTGRKHQLRMHASLMKSPILGDEKYGSKLKDGRMKRKLYLHAYHLELNFMGKNIKLKAKLPDYFREAMLVIGLEYKI